MRKLFIYITVSTLTFFIGTSLLFFPIKFNSYSNANSKINIIRLPEAVDEPTILKPNGNELKVEFQILDNNSFKAKLTNISAKKVFCFFVPKSRNGIFGLHHFIEKRKSNSDEFEYFSGQDSFPPPSPILPNQSIEFQFSAFKKGEYRIKIPYLIDENTVSLYEKKVQPDFTELEEEQALKSTETFTTQSVRIIQNK
ncbi:MAG: hypothetical protein ACR2HG_05220 [Pyrinomonadaceae bacterium]